MDPLPFTENLSNNKNNKKYIPSKRVCNDLIENMDEIPVLSAGIVKLLLNDSSSSPESLGSKIYTSDWSLFAFFESDHKFSVLPINNLSFQNYSKLFRKFYEELIYRDLVHVCNTNLGK